MIYNDYGLINRDGSINLQYAFEWMETLKEKYDMREILQFITQMVCLRQLDIILLRRSIP